jgi:hypothetical protein
LIRLQGNRRQPNGCNWLNNHLKIGYCDFGIQYFMGDTLVAHIWTWFERNDLSKSVFCRIHPSAAQESQQLRLHDWCWGCARPAVLNSILLFLDR